MRSSASSRRPGILSLALCLALLFSLLPLPSPAESDQALMEVPDMTLTDADGKTVTLYSFYGTPVVINFWASWCPWCLREFPCFQEMYEEYGDRVQFIMADLCDGWQETRASALKCVSDAGYTFPVFFDTVNYAYRHFGWGGIPGTVLIRADGTVAMTHLGAMNAETLRAALSGLVD